MNRRMVRVLLAAFSAPVLLQVGCLSAGDLREITTGQFVAFVNAIINATVSDAIRGALGG